MKNLFRTHVKLFLAGLVLIFLALFFREVGIPYFNQLLTQQKANNVQELVNRKASKSREILNELKSQSLSGIISNFDQYKQKAQNHELLLFIYRGRELLLWTNNTVMPKEAFETKTQLHRVKMENGVFLQTSDYKEDFTYKILIPVKNDYGIQNEYLKNKLRLGHNTRDYVKYAPNKVNNQGYNISNENGNFLFALKPKNDGPQHSWPLWIALGGFLLLLLGINLLLHRCFARRKILKGFLLLGLLTLLIIVDWQWLRFPNIIFEKAIFDTAYLQDVTILQTLGDLFIFTLLLTILNHYLTKYARFSFSISNSGLIYYGVFFPIGVGLVYLIGYMIEELVLNPEVYLNVRNFYQLNFLSLLSLITIYLFFYNLFRLVHWSYQQFKPSNSREAYAIALITIVVLVYLALWYLNIIASLYPLIFTLLLWFGLLFFQQSRSRQVNLLLFVTLISSIYSSSLIIEANKIKEKESRKQLAKRLTVEGDAVTEYLFEKVSRKIKTDNYVRSFFGNPLISKNHLEKRIKQLYFSGYLNKYDIKIHTYNANGVPYKSPIVPSLSYFKDLINKKGEETDVNNLYFIKNPGKPTSYLTLYRFQRNSRTIGTLIIEIRERVFYEESIYPALLLESRVKNPENIANYSYGIYNNNRMVSQKGDYPFPVVSYLRDIDKPFHFYKDENYSHLLYLIDEGNFIILSRELPGSIYPLSVFSFLFLIFLMLGFLFHQFPNLKSFKNPFKAFQKQGLKGLNPFRNLLFQHKIQVAILSAVLLVLLIVGIGTVNYLKLDYQEKLHEEIERKIKLISAELGPEIQQSQGSIYQNKEAILAKIKKLSGIYQLDINVFDLHGHLLTSSQPRIYDEGIIEGLMNSDAFYSLRIQQRSQHIQTESIGQLNYLAAYTPIRNENNQILGYLNLPYFTQESKLRNEISSVIVTLVNLYVFLFLIVGIISFLLSKALTNPLSLIREKLRKVQLGQSNEPIKWKSKDEIGQLINEYNKMIQELEESADALARSERESAWREMARQVAHEIKNPLTPMKLNIQRLEQSVKEDDPNLKENFLKTSQILIGQINHLSQIATEFSAFARMPQEEHQELEVEPLIENIVEFYHQSDRIHLQFLPSNEGSKILADKNHLERVFNNLIKNATQAIPEERQGIIKVFSRQTNGYILIEIQDNGIGIPEDKQEKVFQPSFSTKSSGMGLGLAIVKKIIEGANGTIWFESTPGQGTSFYIKFPLIEEKD